MKKKQFTILLILLLAISGCASKQKPASKWIGHNENELITDVGKPDKTIPLENGRKMLIWERYETTSQSLPCVQSYTVDPNGKIIDFSSSSCAPRQTQPTFRNPIRQF